MVKYLFNKQGKLPSHEYIQVNNKFMLIFETNPEHFNNHLPAKSTQSGQLQLRVSVQFKFAIDRKLCNIEQHCWSIMLQVMQSFFFIFIYAVTRQWHFTWSWNRV